MSGIDEVVEKAIRLSTPSQEERAGLRRVLGEAMSLLRDAAERLGVRVDIEVHGSVAHDTWLPGEKDIDIFLLFDPSLGRERIVSEGLMLAKMAFPRHIERYSEHPFITALYKGYRVDVVPAARIRKPSERLTAADRTPLHTAYLNRKLSDEARRHIRAFKMLLRSTGLYGAELRVGGFSGYLSELLILYYGSLQDLLRGASGWKPYKTFLSIEAPIRKAFNDPLVFIDPVDPGRNAAAALTLQRMSEFILLARLLLKKPKLDVFRGVGREIKKTVLLKLLGERGSDLVFIAFKPPQVPPDTLWGELYRSLRGVARLLENHGFKVPDMFAWTDERTLAVMGYEVSSTSLPPKVEVRGPPVWMGEGADSFISKHRHVWVRGDRLYAYKARKYTDVHDLLRSKILRASIGPDVREALKAGYAVLSGRSAVKWAFQRPDLYQRLVEFILKSPWWVELLA